MKNVAAGHGRRFSSTVLVAVAVFSALVLMFALVMSGAVEQERLAREINGDFKEYVADPSASLNRVIFAAHRMISFVPVPGESAAAILEKKISAAEGLLSHAQFVKDLDGASIARLFGRDPLMIVPRLVASNDAYEAELSALRSTVDAAAAAGDLEERTRLVEAFRLRTGELMSLLEARSMLLVQMEDSFFAVSRERSARLLRHSVVLLVSFAVLVFAFALSFGFYLRSLFRTQKELKYHRDHLSESVERRTEELTAVNDRLRKALKERETLLKEVYHRIKNNLTMITSLISLQKEGSPPETRAGYEDLEHRISAIAMIHARLYGSSDLTSIDLGEYLESLAQNLVGSLSSNGHGIAVRCDARGIRLPADDIIPLGLMMTEIVTNSIKHGFRGRSGGAISIRAGMEGDCLVLSIGDDGASPDDPDLILKSSSLGALLIHELCAQLKGTLELGLGGGTRYLFRFPGIAGRAAGCGRDKT